MKKFIRLLNRSFDTPDRISSTTTERWSMILRGTQAAISFYFLLIVLSLAVCLFSVCSTQKSFYQEASGWDYLRFPLLEPYYAIKITDKFGWTINLYAEPKKSNFRYYPAILDVKGIAVENGIIMVNSNYSNPIELDNGQEGELHWFILLPGQIEKGFETEQEFNIGLEQYEIDQPNWQEPLSILQTFEQTSCLEWIPNCQ